MGKMSERRRKKRKKLQQLAKYMKSLFTIKPRIPVAPPSITFKTKKDYNRSQNKKTISKELDKNE